MGHELHSDVKRLNLSYYRRYVYRMFGSMEWMHTVIALGQIPADFVEIMRGVCERRRALASAQGRAVPNLCDALMTRLPVERLLVIPGVSRRVWGFWH